MEEMINPEEAVLVGNMEYNSNAFIKPVLKPNIIRKYIV